jgi:hypothetical protein
VSERTGWRPRRSVENLLDDVFAWLRAGEPVLRGLVGGPASRRAGRDAR